MNLLSTFSEYLYRHKIFNFLLVLAYFLIVVLPHKEVGIWIASALDKPLGRQQYNNLILALGTIGMCGYLYSVWKGSQHLKSEVKNTLFTYLLFTIILIVISINILMVINIEIVHLVQYAILFILLFPFFYNYTATLFWATFLGAVDEAYQYLILMPNYEYYDFNDIIIDLLGAALGLIIVATYIGKEQDKVSNKIRKPNFFRKNASVILGTIFIIILSAIAYFQGYLVIDSVKGEEHALFPLVRKEQIGFWKELRFGIKYHVIRPLEGIITIVILLRIYAIMDTVCAVEKPVNEVC